MEPDPEVDIDFDDFDEVMDALPQSVQNKILAKLRGEKLEEEGEIELPDIGFTLWQGTKFTYPNG